MWRGPYLIVFLCMFAYSDAQRFVLSLRSEFRVVMSAVVPAYKRCLVRFYLQLFVGSLMSCLHYLSLFAYTIVVSMDWPFWLPLLFSLTSFLTWSPCGFFGRFFYISFFPLFLCCILLLLYSLLIWIMILCTILNLDILAVSGFVQLTILNLDILTVSVLVL